MCELTVGTIENATVELMELEKAVIEAAISFRQDETAWVDGAEFTGKDLWNAVDALVAAGEKPSKDEIDRANRAVERSPDCCGCPSFPYALCPPCHRYNHAREKQ